MGKIAAIFNRRKLIKFEKHLINFRILLAGKSLERDGIKSLLRLFDVLDFKINQFKNASGIDCPSGCGRCCESDKVEATVFELLPSAIYLHINKESAFWLDKAEEANSSGPCIFYKNDPAIPGNGSCSVYALRPLVCRMFGFSTASDKYQRKHLVACSIIKELNPSKVKNAQIMIESGLPVPKMGDYSIRIFNMNPDLGRVQMPINQAVKMAIEKVGFSQQLRKRRGKVNLAAQFC